MRDDGGGNRAGEEVRVNSILFGAYTTCKIQKRFYG